MYSEFLLHRLRPKEPGPEPLLAEATLNGPGEPMIPIDYVVNRFVPAPDAN
jgi:hypothetical protein